MPACHGVYGEKPGDNCTAPSAARSQTVPANSSNSTAPANLSQYNPKDYEHYRPPFPVIKAGDKNIWKLQVCNGSPGERDGVNCTSAKAFNAKEHKDDAHKPNPTGETVKICDGKNDKEGCIEPDQMRSVQSRPNANAPPIPPNSTPDYVVAQKPPSTGDKVTICDGKNAKEGCMEPNDMRNPKTRPNAISPAGYQPSTPKFNITP